MNTRIALIGCGYWGKNVGRSLAKLGVLAAVVDGDPERAAAYAAEYSTETMTLDQVLADSSIDGIAIATPAETHFDVASLALNAGKDVFVEKPMALHPEHGEAMVDLARRQGRILMVGHLLQYHSAFIKLKELVSAGDLGRLQYVYSNRLNFGKIRREEDVLWSFAPHDISMILSLAGEAPSEIKTEGRFLLHSSIADVTTTHLGFPSGLAGHIFVSWLHPMKEQRLVVIGERGMAVFDDREPLDRKLALYQTQVEWLDGAPVAPKAEPTFVSLPESEPLLTEMAHFAECVETRNQPRTDGAEGLRVLKVLTEAGSQLLERSQNPSTSGIRPTTSGPAPMVEPSPTAIPVTTSQTPPTAQPQPVVDLTRPMVQIADSAMVHESAFVDDGASVGENTKIWHFSHVMGKTSIGSGCSLGQNVVAGPNVSIGNGCKIQNNVSIYDGVTLEDDVFCGPSMVFTNVTNPRAFVNRKDEFAPTLVKRGATIGANATIVCGTTVGEYSLIAAGAVVTKDVKPYALMVGVPARQIGWVSTEGEVLDESLRCPRTGETFQVIDEQLVPGDKAATASGAGHETNLPNGSN